jgi:hypothetical protein
MVTGFAAGGLVDLVPALAVMLGANVGTTLIVQALSFNGRNCPGACLMGSPTATDQVGGSEGGYWRSCHVRPWGPAAARPSGDSLGGATAAWAGA